MKIGVNLLNFGPGVNPQALESWIKISEALGYHLVMVSDHIAITPDVNSRYPAPFYEPFTTLGWIAGITTTMRIGTTVLIVPYRNPLETAKAAANLDQLSGGRLILGIGVGWSTEEFIVLGSPFKERGAVTNEYLTIMKRFWTEDVLSYDGTYIKFQDVRTAPKPIQSPHPPIWVGGQSHAAMERAVLHGDAYHPIRINTTWLSEQAIPKLTSIANQNERNMPAICPRIRLRITEYPMQEDQRIAGEGSLGQIHEDLKKLEDLGCQYVLLDTYYDDVKATENHEASWSMLSIFAEHIVDLRQEMVR